MTFFDPQNPGIGGIDELTDAETLTVQQISALGDPNADRLLGWDDTDNSYKFITIGSGLTYTHATHTLSSSGGGGATTALSNLASVAINTTLVSDTDVTDDLGTESIRWNMLYVRTLETGHTTGKTLNINAWDVDGASSTNFIILTSGNTPTGRILNITSDTNFNPTTNDAGALGTTALGWSDLFLATGGVINWNNSEVTLTEAVGGLTLAGGTITTSSPVLSLTQTWNNVATTFTGLLLNVTNTTSATGSLLADIQVGGSTRLNVSATGKTTVTGGADVTAFTITGGTLSTATSTLSITGTWNNSGTVFTAIDMNITSTAASATSMLMNLKKGGTSIFQVRNDGILNLVSGGEYRTTGGQTIAYTNAGIRAGGTANSLALGYAGNASSYGSEVDVYGITHATLAGIIQFRTGTASAQQAVVWTMDTSGNFIAGTDNAWDIGASGATRPRTGYFGTSVVVPTAKITSLVQDSGGNTIINLGATGSAVNYVKITNAATGTAGPIVAADGETNVDLKIAGKGTGKVHHTTGMYGDVTAYSPAGAGTATLTCNTSNVHSITMPAGNITIALSNDSVGQILTIDIIQDSSGSRTVTWFSGIKWAGGSPPTLTTTANKIDSIVIRVVTAGSAYYGMVAGQNI